MLARLIGSLIFAFDGTLVDSIFQAFLSPDSRMPPFASKAEAVASLLGQYNLDPAHTLLMGDSLDDARAAQACGLWMGAPTSGRAGGAGVPQVCRRATTDRG